MKINFLIIILNLLKKIKKKEKVIISDKLNIEGVSNFGRIKKKKIFDF